MFLARDQTREYTYTCLMTDLRAHQGRLGLDTRNTPHGLRVLGYNLSKSGNGEDLTVAHGGWMSTAHDRYERFPLSQQLSIPANMLRRRSVFDDREGRAISRVNAPRHSHDLPVDGAAEEVEQSGDSSEESEDALSGFLPPGFEARRHETPSGRVYETYHGPGGVQARSRVAAWREHSARVASQVGAEVPIVFDVSSPVPAGPPSAGGSGSESTSARRSGRLTDTLRRLRLQCRSAEEEPAPDAGGADDGRPRALPFGATVAQIEVDATQCGNPLCTVKAHNGKHQGLCVFPPPSPRRGRA
jgi:hypothetical protein